MLKYVFLRFTKVISLFTVFPTVFELRQKMVFFAKNVYLAFFTFFNEFSKKKAYFLLPKIAMSW